MRLIGRGGKDGVWEEDEWGCGGIFPSEAQVILQLWNRVVGGKEF